MNHKIITSLLVGLSTLLAGATNSQKGYNSLVFERLDGSMVEYSFNEMPKIYFDEVNLCLTTNSYTVTYPTNELRRYYFKDKSSSIETVTINSDIYFDNDRLSFYLNKANEKINMYSLTGALIASAITSSEGCATINIENIPCGIYIIEYLNVSTKIMKR